MWGTLRHAETPIIPLDRGEDWQSRQRSLFAAGTAPLHGSTCFSSVCYSYVSAIVSIHWMESRPGDELSRERLSRFSSEKYLDNLFRYAFSVVWYLVLTATNRKMAVFWVTAAQQPRRQPSSRFFPHVSNFPRVIIVMPHTSLYRVVK
jgi:hypothetical protein